MSGRTPRRSVPRALLVIALLALPLVPHWGHRPAAAGPESNHPAELEILAMEDQRRSGPALLDYLQDPSADIRARATLAIGRIGRAEDVPALATALDDDEVRVRRSAAFALGEIPDSTAADPLIEVITGGTEPDAEVRLLAVEGLGKIGRGAEACRVALRDPEWEVRAQALLAAWKIPVPDILDEVIALTASEDPDLRWPATYCLMRLVGAPASGATAIPESDEMSETERELARTVLMSLTRDADARVRLQAVRGLRTFGEADVTAILLERATDEDWRVRVEAVRALASSVQGTQEPEPRDIVIADLTPFLDDAHPNVRVAAVEALGGVGSSAEAIRLLVTYRQSPEPRIRQVAYATLVRRWAETGDPIPPEVLESIERLSLRLLDEENDWSLRAGAIDGAALLPPDRRLPILERVLADDPRAVKLAVQPYLTLRAEDGSGPLWSRVGPDVDRLGTSPDPMVRLMVVYTLGELFAADSVYTPTEDDWTRFQDHLLYAYTTSLETDELSDVREAVVGVAADFTDRPAMHRLNEDACHDPNYIVRLAAVDALRSADHTPPREAGPVETGRQPTDYRVVLEWTTVDHWAVVRTEIGVIVVRLHGRDAPLTAWNFATLANGGFYDEGRWHRVVPDFVLQDGCPRGDGWGGPAWQIRCEINRHRYTTGAMGMALSGKDTGGSQYFFTHSDQPHLDGGYTVFGHIVEGQDIADRVTQGMPILSVRVLDFRP